MDRNTVIALMSLKDAINDMIKQDCCGTDQQHVEEISSVEDANGVLRFVVKTWDEERMHQSSEPLGMCEMLSLVSRYTAHRAIGPFFDRLEVHKG